MFKHDSAFTLIELLIVIAIIAILALIAVPNFLEAQIRAKIARVKADMRSLSTAMESYYVDYNGYPFTRLNASVYVYHRYTGFAFRECPPGDIRNDDQIKSLTTPIAYFSGPAPADPFMQGYDEYEPLTGGCWNFSYWYINIHGAAMARHANLAEWNRLCTPRSGSGTAANPAPVVVPAPLRFNGPDAHIHNAFWTMSSPGPDRSYIGPTHMSPYMLWSEMYWDFFTKDGHFEFYDPTNGTASGGDIWRFGGGGGGSE